jgi:hypothetical protein
VSDLGELLAASPTGRPGTVVLMQAGTSTEKRYIRERVAAAGGRDQPLVSFGPPEIPGGGLPADLLARDDDTTLVPVRVAWLPEEHAGRRAARLNDMLPGHDPYHPSDRQQRRILARQPGRAVVLAGEPATVGSLRQHWTETTDGDDFGSYVARRARPQVQDAEPGQRRDPVLPPVPIRAARGPAGR